MESKDASAREHFGEGYEATKLGGKLHRAFMAEIGEEMCQNEVAHHANRCPEYFCSRPEKWVYLLQEGPGHRPAFGDEGWGETFGHRPVGGVFGHRPSR